MKIRLGSEDRINLLIVAFVSFDVLVLSFNGMRYIPIFNVGLATYLYALSYAAVIACALPIIWKKINYTDIIILISIFIILICNYLFFPNTHMRMSTKIVYFLQATPWFFVGRYASDYGSLLSWLEKAAKVTIIIAALYYIVRIINSYDNSYNNMDYAYKFLPSCIVAAYSLIKNLNFKNIFFNVIGISVLVLCGCRGAVLCLGVAMLIFIFFFSDKTAYKIAAILIFAAAAVLYMSNYFYLMIMSLNRWMNSMGIDNRIFRQILLDEFSDGSGRGIIAGQVFSGIAERPFLGYGLYGDTTLTALGTYSHNIVLEFMASFGVPVGIALFLALVVSFLIIITSKRNPTEYKIVLIIFFCTGFVKLFMSSSFTQEASFYLLIGMLAANKQEIAQAEKKYLFYEGQNEMTVQNSSHI